MILEAEFGTTRRSGDVFSSTLQEQFSPGRAVELLGVPPASGFAIEVIAVEYHPVTTSGIHGNQTSEWKVEDCLSEAVRLIPIGWIRQQKIAKLEIDTGHIERKDPLHRSLRRLVLRIGFRVEEDSATGSGRTEQCHDSETFEEVLKYSIANYEDGKQYRAWATNTGVVSANRALKVGHSYARIVTSTEGIYRISGNDLLASGFDLNEIKSSSLRLSNLGDEIPIWVETQSRDIFENSDHITFVAVKPSPEYEAYTDLNVYWLSWSDVGGRRIALKDGDLGEPIDIPSSLRVTYHGEENREYLNPPLSDDGDRWLWARISAEAENPGKRYFAVPDLSDIDIGKDFTIRLSLLGLTDDPSALIDHHAIISINGHILSDIKWAGQEVYEFAGEYPSSYLVEGDNFIEVRLPGDLNVFADQVGLDWFEIEWSTTRAQDGLLQFAHRADRGPGIYEFRCRDFRNDDLEVFDISDPYAPERFVGVRIENEATADVIFRDRFDRIGQERSYLVLRSSRMLKPEKIEKVTFGRNLASRSHRSDIIIIAPAEFSAAVAELAHYRAGRGLDVVVVNVEEIYDQFTYGLFSPTAIRRFLRAAFENWQWPPPSNVLLVGDATWDYKNHLKYDKRNFVPSFQVKALGDRYAASDSWFVCVSGDDILPDMHVGRIAVGTVEELREVIRKIIQYEEVDGDQSWKKRVAFVADDENSSFEEQCELMSERVIPETIESVKLYLRSLGLPEGMPLHERIARTKKGFSLKVLETINRGCGVVQFVGHGGLRVWSRKHILDSRRNVEDWGKLANRGRYPIVFSFSCLNGYFDSPRFPTIAERFVNVRGKGAIAFAANTRDSIGSEGVVLNVMFLESIFDLRLRSLGAVITRSKIRALTGIDDPSNYMNTFALIGDPALEIDF
ncbi:MAG: hypothetical protein GY835_23285 [bacterium]|nr:hypothetical protein [bacterium]